MGPQRGLGELYTNLINLHWSEREIAEWVHREALVSYIHTNLINLHWPEREIAQWVHIEALVSYIH